ncbi:(4Fe-4S)-binding protein [Deltaproteobacteria bacterium]|nr:(4Fe-4S)-binding protein [Deltaproteobacteria bacterium]
MTVKKKTRIRQRVLQTLSLFCFFYLLFNTVYPLTSALTVDIYMRLDPLVTVAVPLAARAFSPALIAGLLTLVSGFFLGRAFCGYICPMGAALDMARCALNQLPQKTASQAAASPRPRRVKFLILALIVGAALLGCNLAFWASPMAILTRFFAVWLYPALLWSGNAAVSFGQALFHALDMNGLVYSQVPPRAFGDIFILVFFGLLVLMERKQPRFWCRNVCPAGALIALVSRKPRFLRRGVGKDCVSCGLCAKKCPMSAISEDGRETTFGECLVCRACAAVCPKDCISFDPARAVPEDARAEDRAPYLPSRRSFLLSAGAGAALAVWDKASAANTAALGAEDQEALNGSLRPPGALPEKDFLARCLRCGQCLKACPNNALRSGDLHDGNWGGLFSPVFSPREGGPCEPDCNVCGQVCPSRAIAPLTRENKMWAKIGTAALQKERCLAIAENRRCVVCQEVCPYGAVDLVLPADRNVSIPMVNERACTGCGFCMHACPVPGESAIVIVPRGTLRLPEGADYQKEGRKRGYHFEPGGRYGEDAETGTDAASGGKPPPGFTN